MNDLQSRVDNLIHECWKSFSHKAGNELFTVTGKEAMHLQFAKLLSNSIDLVIYDKREIVNLELYSAFAIGERKLIIDILLELHNGKENVAIPLMVHCFIDNHSLISPLEFSQNVYLGFDTHESLSTLPRILTGYSLLMTNSRAIVRNQNDVVDWDISDGKDLYGTRNFSLEKNGENYTFTLQKDYSFEWHQHGSFWFSLIQGV